MTKKKLHLHTETIHVMNREALSRVHGGKPVYTTLPACGHYKSLENTMCAACKTDVGCIPTDVCTTRETSATCP